MAEIFDEIHEEILREKFFKQLRQWFPYIIGLSVAALLGTGGYLYYQSWREKRIYMESFWGNTH